MRRKLAAAHPGQRVGADTMIAQIPSELPGELPDEQQLTHVWRREREHAILAEAISILRDSARMEEHTFKAFELFALRGVPAEEVARQCAIAVDSVYVIKNRLTKRLREIVAEITEAYDDGE
jgi:DNA-directed RNA polymerase specialized sigma24 family protein